MSNTSKKPAFNLEEEIPNLPIVYITYRDNMLFREHMPTLIEMLTIAGRKVKTKIFPPETTHGEIEIWFNENWEDFRGIDYVHDRTCQSCHSAIYTDSKIRQSRPEETKPNSINLDWLFRQVAEAEIKNALGIQKSERLNEHSQKECIVVLLKNVLSDPQNHPSEVKICTPNILDHLFYKIKEEKGENADTMANAAIELKDWLIEAGIKKETIWIQHYSSHERGELAEKLLEDEIENQWIFADRHFSMNFKWKIRKAIVLSLGAGDILEETTEYGLFKCKRNSSFLKEIAFRMLISEPARERWYKKNGINPFSGI